MKNLRLKSFEKMPTERFEALFGRTTDLAKSLRVPVATVAAWKARGKIPSERVLQVAAATGISPHYIRPDLYPARDLKGAA